MHDSPVTITAQDKQFLDALEADLKDIMKHGTTGAATIPGPVGIDVPPAALSLFKLQLLALLRLFKRAEGNEAGSGGPPWNAGTAYPQRVPQFAKADLVSNMPASAHKGSVVYVDDEAGGAVLAFSDGTTWRRVTDRNPVS